MGRYDPNCCRQCGIEISEEPYGLQFCMDCRRRLTKVLIPQNQTKTDTQGYSASNLLAIEVERYLDKPGCNVNSKKVAMERLRWALKKFRKDSGEKRALL